MLRYTVQTGKIPLRRSRESIKKDKQSDIYTDRSQATFHDFINYRKWLKFAAGHKILATVKNRIYITAVFVMLVYFLVMSAEAVMISINDSVMFFHSVHTFLLVIVPLGTLINRCLNDGILTETATSFQNGVYTYLEDPNDEEQHQIRIKAVRQIKYLSKIFSVSLAVGASSNTILLPIMQLLLNEEDTNKKAMNPYLPQPFYMPFDSRTFRGYCMAYLLNVIYMVYLCILVTCTDELFISITLQLKAQLQILNRSLANIEKRAYWRTFRTRLEGNLQGDVYRSPLFQRSMYLCLQSNIQHHQALIRLRKSFEKYTSKSFLLIFTLSSLVMAGMIMLIMESPGVLFILNFSSSLLAEMLFTFHFCWYSEQLAEESDKLFRTLYATPWHKCDREFNVLLSVMMAKAKTPFIIETASFHITASLKTFGNIITTMYQIMNVARSFF